MHAVDLPVMSSSLHAAISRISALRLSGINSFVNAKRIELFYGCDMNIVCERYAVRST